MYSRRCGWARGLVTQTRLNSTQLSPGCGTVVGMPTWSNAFLMTPVLRGTLHHAFQVFILRFLPHLDRADGQPEARLDHPHRLPGRQGGHVVGDLELAARRHLQLGLEDVARE